MSFVYNLLLFLHFVGLALLLGAFLVQVRDPQKTVTRWMWDGALTQVVTGLLMVGMLSMNMLPDEAPNNAIVGVKLIIAVVIAVLAFVGKKKPAPQVGLWATIGALTLLNMLIAVFVGVIAA